MKKKYIAFFLVVLAILVLLPGCVYFNLGPTNAPSPTLTASPIDSNFTPPSTTNQQLPPENPAFVSVVDSVRPSVVAINTEVPTLNVFGGSFSQQGAGSGWIIDPGGLIVTNNHVIEGANSITVTLEDGRNFSAILVRTDAVSDLAVIKINADNLPAAKVGDSTKMRVGDWVIAIGNSLGQGISVTKGIISATGVSVSVGAGETLYNLIQTDAAINPGNSGGPLVNLLGEVVGITSIKVAEVGIEGTGYAISTKEAMPIIDDLVKLGYAIRPWVGVNLYTVDRLVILRYSLGVDQGALITQVTNGSPADKAGLKSGDVITAIDGKQVAVVDDYNTILHNYRVGQQASITYYRGTNPTTVALTLASSPPPG